MDKFFIVMGRASLWCLDNQAASLSLAGGFVLGSIGYVASCCG